MYENYNEPNMFRWNCTKNVCSWCEVFFSADVYHSPVCCVVPLHRRFLFMIVHSKSSDSSVPGDLLWSTKTKVNWFFARPSLSCAVYEPRSSRDSSSISTSTRPLALSKLILRFCSRANKGRHTYRSAQDDRCNSQSAVEHEVMQRWRWVDAWKDIL